VGGFCVGATGSAQVADFPSSLVIHSPAPAGKKRPVEAVFSLEIFRLA